ncbi:MAG: hypothetical protein SGPRY_012113 [Prymnesium sp.]
MKPYDYAHVNGKRDLMGGEVFRGHIGGDKFSGKGSGNRTAFYASYLARYAPPPSACRPRFSIVEIGVFRGESLAVWAAVFPHASLTGVDGNLRPFHAHLPSLRARGAFKWGEPTLLEGDSMEDTGALTSVADRSVDVIIDDGCHLPSCQLATCRRDDGRARGECGVGRERA